MTTAEGELARVQGDAAAADAAKNRLSEAQHKAAEASEKAGSRRSKISKTLSAILLSWIANLGLRRQARRQGSNRAGRLPDRGQVKRPRSPLNNLRVRTRSKLRNSARRHGLLSYRRSRPRPDIPVDIPSVLPSAVHSDSRGIRHQALHQLLGICRSFRRLLGVSGTITRMSMIRPRRHFSLTHRGHHLLTHAVAGFFANGGTKCFVARVNPENIATGRALDQFESIEDVSILAAPGLPKSRMTLGTGCRPTARPTCTRTSSRSLIHPCSSKTITTFSTFKKLQPDNPTRCCRAEARMPPSTSRTSK